MFNKKYLFLLIKVITCQVFVFLLMPILKADNKVQLPKLPLMFHENTDNYSEPILSKDGRVYTLNPFLQNRLTKYIRQNRSPIAAVVIINARTGKILAMAQGRSPQAWGSPVHTALYNRFPAASLFKIVVSSATLELTDLDPKRNIGLKGGCSNVRPTGVWLQDSLPSGRYNKMNLRKAFGSSCNSFFAKLAVNVLGLNIITKFAYKYGWGSKVYADFNTEPSPINPPSVNSSSVHIIGRYAAGFGYVGLSAIHAAWIGSVIANNGIGKRLFIFDSLGVGSIYNNIFSLSAKVPVKRVISKEAAIKLRSIMDYTVRGGTATYAFRRGKYRRLRYKIGGKTGTLSGKAPKGITTWFLGMMPIDDPEIVVSTVVVLQKRWHIKAPNLAAEAFWLYDKMKREESKKYTSNSP